MKDEIVSEHVAILAKEIGFDEPCLYWYGEEDTWGQKSKLKEPISLQTHRNSKAPSNTYSAPTQSLLQKWLREVHWVDITIYRSFSFTHSYHYCIVIDCDYENELLQMSESNRSYEVCLEDALLEGLKMIKKK